MNDGVAMLLERMKTNPEEFVIEEGVVGKWDILIRSYEAVLDPEDIALFKQARGKLLQQRFTEKVMEELIDPKKSSLKQLLDLAKGTPTATTTQGAYTVNASGTITSWENREPLGQTIARLEEIKKEYETPKKSKTLFGRLFNYQ